MKLHPEEKREDDIPFIAGKKKIYFSVQVREGNLSFSDVLISEHTKGCVQLCLGYSQICQQLDKVQRSACWHVFISNDNVAN